MLQILEHIVPKYFANRKLTVLKLFHMIFETESVQSFLQQEFDRRIRTNPRYSLRAYSRSLGLSSGALSEILRAQRPVSLKVAAKVAKSLGFNAAEKKRLFELTNLDKQNSLMNTASFVETEINLEQKKLDEDTFHLVSEWHHFAILNLMDCEGFVWSASYIAKRLGVTMAQAQTAMNLLLRVGLVIQKQGKFQSVQDYVLAPDGITSEAIRSYHRQIMGKAIEALEVQNVAEREMSGIGFAVDPARL